MEVVDLEAANGGGRRVTVSTYIVEFLPFLAENLGDLRFVQVLQAFGALLKPTTLTKSNRTATVSVRSCEKIGMIARLADESVCPTEQHSRNQNRADGGVGRGPGGPPHKSSQAAMIFGSSSTDQQLGKHAGQAFSLPGVRGQ